MKFTFKIYPNNTSGRARELITTQFASNLDDAIKEATKILRVFRKSADVVFMIEYDGESVAGICPEVDDWVRF